MHIVNIKRRVKEHSFIYILGLFSLVGLIAVFVFEAQHNENNDRDLVIDESGQKVVRAPLAESGVKFDYIFNCRDGKTFTTSYDLGSNALTLIVSPELSYVLPQDVSKMGAYYSTVDGQVTFFERAGKARVEINGEVEYENCEASPAEVRE